MQPIQPTESMTRPYRTRGEAWLNYAGIMLFLVGALHAFQGLVMVSGDEIFTDGPDADAVVIGNIETWGWVILIVGILEMLAGVGVFSRNQLARWFGVAAASIGLLSQFPVFFGPHPLWSLTVVLLCALVIYGLVVYGDTDGEAA